jgi:Cu/Ag efflux protein CusF
MTFRNLSSKRQWSEEECRVMVNAALLKLIDDAGGVITLSTHDLLTVAMNGKGTLAMSVSDDDKILTLTRIKEGD